MNWEFRVLDFIERKFHSKRWTRMMKLATNFGEKGIFLSIWTLIMGANKKTRKEGVTMGLGLIIEALLCNLVLKPSVGRTRPYDIREKIELLIPKLKDASFPSGHTGATFATAAALFFSKTKMWIPAALMACSTGFSRMYFYVHYPTDILGGAALGVSSGWAAARLQKRWEKKRHAKRTAERRKK
ncbi:MAG: phosphatase PAP2 family protein [Clostridiales bacterium]|nr:phosphatase PAP2 family protein [Candidatus Blautia equi]